MASVLFVLAAIGVTVYAAIDCLRAGEDEMRTLPKPLWLLLIVAVPLFGGLVWILLGRGSLPGSPPSRRLRTVGPDDDPDFLRTLNPGRPAAPDDEEK